VRLRLAVVAGLAAAALLPSAAHAQCVGGAADANAKTADAVPHVIARAANVGWCGGPVMHSSRVHLIFWQPAGAGLAFDPGYEQVIETFVKRVVAADRSTSNLFGLMGQYPDSVGPAAYDFSYGGAIVDTDPLPTESGSTCTEPLAPPLGTGPGWSDCVNDSGIETEIERVVRQHDLPTGLADVYVLLTPSGFGSCFYSGPSECADGGSANDGYCGYHSATGNPGAIYAVIPYNAVSGHCQSTNPRPNDSTADPAISTISHELAESETDPLGDAWIDNSGNEIADLCITSYGPALGGSGSGRYDEVIDGGHYWIQELWSNYARACEPSAKPDKASFVVAARKPAPHRRYEVTFAARASDPQGRIVTYTWTFGDGRKSGSGRTRVTHTFARRGTYTVVLRTTDNWGNWTFATRRVRVGAGR
jgi:PKD domain